MNIILGRIFTFIYGVVSYAAFLFTILYAIGFIGNFVVPKSVDSFSGGSGHTAVWIDLGLLSVFALQHSVMARPGFKRILTRIVPTPLERSTYVLASSAALLFCSGSGGLWVGRYGRSKRSGGR